MSPDNSPLPAHPSAHVSVHSPIVTAFDRLASRVTQWAGSPMAFCIFVCVVVAWAATGPLFDYSSNWKIAIGTFTSTITFLMVFLIQQSQNKDSVAIHLKLNELLASNRDASNRMIGIEGLDEQDLHDVARFYTRLAERAKSAGAHNTEPHSIDDEGMPVLGQPQGD